MPGFLFNNLIFGPVSSRRLGRSLGINLLPLNAKWCNFNCIYCECGWSAQYNDSDVFPNADEIIALLEQVLLDELKKNQKINAITFAGNGEPTLHPDFELIVQKVIELRKSYAPLAQVAVLTNSTMLHKKNVRDALSLVDKAILKLDTAIQRTFELINQPFDTISVQTVIENIQKLEVEKYVQTMFFSGNRNGFYVDNTSEEELAKYLSALEFIRPKQVMIYSLDRETPDTGLKKIDFAKLEEISKRIQLLGFDVLLTP